MGEPSMELLEQTVQHVSEDVRDIKKRVDKLESDQYDLKANQQLTQHTMTSLAESLNDLKADLKQMRKEMQDDRRVREEEKQEEFDRLRGLISKFGFSIAATVIAGMVAAILLI